MNLQQLTYFKTVAEVLNFTKAADILCITQPSLSHSIQDLEKELNIQLFIRQGRSIQLTKYGQLYLDYVVQALNILDAGRIKLNEYTQPAQGTVVLSYLSSLTEYVPFVTSLYLSGHPGIHTRFHMEQLPTGQIESNLIHGQSNLGFSSQVSSPRLGSFYVGEHPSVLIVSEQHPWADRTSVSLQELDGQDFITYTQDCGIRKYIDNILHTAGVQPRIISEVMYDNLIIGMVGSNFGVAMIPKPLGMHLSQCRCISLEGDVPPRKIYLVWPKELYIPPAAQKFLDFVVDHAVTLDYFIKHR